MGTVLGNPAALGRVAAGYLRGAIAAATDHVCAGLALAALATIIVILVIAPRNLAISPGDGVPGDRGTGG